MNKLNASVLPLVGLSVVLSMSALIAVAARWPNTTSTSAPAVVVAHRQALPVQTVRVVMHDPGCHWFQTTNGVKRTLHVTGMVSLLNQDETTIKVAGASGTKLDKVGGHVKLGPGTYRITMVGQAPDDNHLKLVVNS